jgi:hypothetical protein
LNLQQELEHGGIGLGDSIARVQYARAAGQPGQGERRESSTDMRRDGDEMAADADDGDGGDYAGKRTW